MEGMKCCNKKTNKNFGISKQHGDPGTTSAALAHLFSLFDSLDLVSEGTAHFNHFLDKQFKIPAVELL